MEESAQSKVFVDGIESVFIPECPDELKPFVGRRFRTLKEGEFFYRDYGGLCGFDTRKSTVKRHSDGTVMRRYIVCSREGEKFLDDEGLECGRSKRRCSSKRASCMARVIFKSIPAGFLIDVFIEEYSHPLMSSTHKQFMRYNHSMTSVHKNFVLSCARSNVGPVKSYCMFSELVGSYESIGWDGVDFKNFHRDLRICVDGADAQMMLDKMKEARDRNPDFYYKYSTDVDDKLKRVFWADDMSIGNYKIFGDSLSMDATYSTNSYAMIFVPFTGLDNHGKCITFAADLLSSENVESYTWLLETFKACMGQCPKLVITNQDPSVKIAMENVMPETRHRFCMWHIMLKVPEKILVALRKNTEFTQRFNSIVWSNELEPTEFEQMWKAVLSEFGLLGHNWLGGMFDLRHYWIPAYFREIPMSRLFRTTSMSESENHFFRTYLNPKANMLMFYLLYKSAIHAQRHTHDKLNATDDSKFPILKTKLPLERSLAEVYLNTMFSNVQAEWVEAVNACCIQKMFEDSGQKMYEIDDTTKGLFRVTFDVVCMKWSCTCMKWEMHGILCMHILKVLKNANINSVPRTCVVHRWGRNISYKRYQNDVDFGKIVESSTHATKKLLDVVFKCAALVVGNPARMNELLSDFESLVSKFQNMDVAGPSNKGKKNMFEGFYGSPIAEEVDVLSPDHVKTKGSGSRIQSRREKALRDSIKPKRMCRRCNQMGHHDSRNCDKIVEDSDTSPDTDA